MHELVTYPILVGGWTALALVVFVTLFFVSAPYGRHRRDGWGPTIDATTGWVLMELPAVVLMVVYYGTGNRRGDLVALAFLLMWQVHYVHRTLVFPFRLRGRGRRAPVAVVLMAFLFNLGNTYFNGRWLFALSPLYPADWLTRPVFLLGAGLWLVGFSINIQADNALLRLRRPGDEGYRIPRGGMYRFISCPNYFGEIVEWCGWAIATWSLGGLSFALWTFANLVPRAVAHHRWYRQTFDEYPPTRRAVIPFVL